jgi:hypothetical protein
VSVVRLVRGRLFRPRVAPPRPKARLLFRSIEP